MATTSSTNQNKRVLWFWKSNRDPFSKKEKEEWTQYSDFENDFIEEAYQRRKEEVEFNDDVIFFKHRIKVKKSDHNRQRPVKREEIDPRECRREERFSFPERAVKSFENEYNREHDFVWQWYSKNEQLMDDKNYAAIAELAAEGESVYGFLFSL